MHCFIDGDVVRTLKDDSGTYPLFGSVEEAAEALKELGFEVVDLRR